MRELTEQGEEKDTGLERQVPTTATLAVGWRDALGQVVPIFLATRAAYLALTYGAVLFTLPLYSTRVLPPGTLLTLWGRWDTGHFTTIATQGYIDAWRTAYFPLYPILEHLGALPFGETYQPAFVAGLVIANLAGLALLAVLYRLVAVDFGRERAALTALFLAIWPAAFFFAAAYSESLFLLLVLLAFYAMRRGHFWLAGLCGLLAALTRSAGLCLVLPMGYEYLRQRGFDWRKIRPGVLACLGAPAGLACFVLYCFVRIGDALAFVHAEAHWNHVLAAPWTGLIEAAQIVVASGSPVGFFPIHSAIDLLSCLFVGALVALAWVGPWRLLGAARAYALFAALVWLYSLIEPISGGDPLASCTRYMLAVWPAFLVLAGAGISVRAVRLSYVVIANALCALLLLQFLTHGWVI